MPRRSKKKKPNYTCTCVFMHLYVCAHLWARICLYVCVVCIHLCVCVLVCEQVHKF